MLHQLRTTSTTEVGRKGPESNHCQARAVQRSGATLLLSRPTPLRARQALGHFSSPPACLSLSSLGSPLAVFLPLSSLGAPRCAAAAHPAAMRTTKGGKSMNPTDSFRKEQRKKELKRNRSERKRVREVGLLRKDPEAIKEQIQRLDTMSECP